MFGRFVYCPSGWIRKRCFGEKVAEIPCWAFIRKEKQNLLRQCHCVVWCVVWCVVPGRIGWWWASSFLIREPRFAIIE